MHPDSRPLNEAQRKKLGHMLHHALVEIRALAGDGQGKRAADLADAFHNLPFEMWRDDFSISYFRKAFIEAYHHQWPDRRWTDYRALLDEVEKLA